MKGYVLTESNTGFVQKYTLNEGKDWENTDIGQGVGHRIVLDMMDGLLDCGYNVFMDNWYSSPILIKELCDRKTNAYGTLRSNRKMCPRT